MENTLRSAPSPWIPSQSFDEFELIRPLGRGGMGQVWLARDRGLDRRVAIKILAGERPSAALQDRFMREARALARLSHPNVVSVYRIGTVEGRRYIAYELVEGQSLEQLPHPLDWVSALALGVGLARGLDAAHSAGILHRDIKPSNAVLSARGEVKLIDFGLAKLMAEDAASPDRPPASMELPAGEAGPFAATLPAANHDRSRVREAGLTQPGRLLGTPSYMAPELWHNAVATVRSDLFAFGMMIYELLVGRLPHADLPIAVMGRRLATEDTPPLLLSRPEIPEQLASTIDRCLRRDPADRPASAFEVSVLLEETQLVFAPSARSGVNLVQIGPDRLAVAASYARIRARVDVFTTRFYERMFALDPALRPLFPANLAQQRDKLVHALDLAIASLGEPQRLVAMLTELGRRHRAYGVREEHFEPFRRALLATLAELDAEHFDDDLALAWKRAIALLESAMLNGLRQPSPVRGLTPEGEPLTPSPSQRAIPRTRYAKSSGTSLAYQVFGEGDTPVLLLAGWVSHVELAWQHATYARFLERLGGFARVLMVDQRGTGMSDRGPHEPSMEVHARDLLAVLDAAGMDRVGVIGTFGSAVQALVFAALYPERTRAVVVHGGAARMTSAPDYPWGQSEARFRAVERKVRSRWNEPDFVELVAAPSMAGDADFRDWLGRYLRSSASPGSAVASFHSWADFDVRPLLPAIRVPTLVLHRAGDRMVPIAAGRHLAASIAGARFVELPGDDHLPFVGDVDRWMTEVERFLGEAQRPGGDVEPFCSIVAVDTSHGDVETAALAAHAAEHGMTPAHDGDGHAWSCRGAQQAVLWAWSLLSSDVAPPERLHLGIASAPSSDGRMTEALALANDLAHRAPAGGALVTEAVRQLVSDGPFFEPSPREGEHVLRA